MNDVREARSIVSVAKESFVLHCYLQSRRVQIFKPFLTTRCGTFIKSTFPKMRDWRHQNKTVWVQKVQQQ